MDGLGRLEQAFRENMVDIVGSLSMVVGVWIAISMVAVIGWLVLSGVCRWVVRQNPEGLVWEIVGIIGICAGFYWAYVISEGRQPW